MTSLCEANAKFSLDVFRKLSKIEPHENIIFSPANLTAALGLLLLGSGSDTATQIENILHWDELIELKASGRRRCLALTTSYSRSEDKLRPDTFHCPSTTVPNYECDKPEGIHAAFHKSLEALNNPGPGYEVDLVNRLYADKNIAFTQKFLYCALKLYLTEVTRVDFQNAPEVQKLIDLWVEVQTHGKIKDFLPKDSFNHDINLLMVNALCFKGQWELPFDKAFTQEVDFKVSENEFTTVEYMYQKGQYNTGTIKESNALVLEVPYRNEDISLFLLLPQDASARSIQQMEDGLTTENLLNMPSILKPQEVEVVIPKFHIMTEFNVNLGKSHAAKPAQNSVMMATKDGGLTELVHYTFFEVDEGNGDKAKERHEHKEKLISDTLHFICNHPFVFYALEKSTKSIILIGRFSKPSSMKFSE